jgi:heme-degrading monooxygenase HmoA
MGLIGTEEPRLDASAISGALLLGRTGMPDGRRYQLAEFNIARMRFPLDDPRMREFREALASVNALADESPGFAWRLESDEGEGNAVRQIHDPQLLLNLSVWESIDALRAFYLAAPHGEFLRRRATWFERARHPYLALWWVAHGHHPSLEEATQRLAMVSEDGPTDSSFDFAHPFPMPSVAP